MRDVIKYGILLLLIFRICLNSSAQKSTFLEQPRLNYLTTNEGLPQNTIDCILKDSKGFMWFGTWNGLCRFDGYTFQIFQSQQEKWLPGNFIHTLCEDQNGNLWVGTYKGLAYFDYSLMKFTEIPLLTENFGGISITHIINDKDNNIWVATAGNGIWKIKNEGHNAAYTFNGQDYLVCHGYDAHDNARQKLIIREITWDKDKWPVVDQTK